MRKKHKNPEKGTGKTNLDSANKVKDEKVVVALPVFVCVNSIYGISKATI
jgi:hypothetical protein